MPRRSDKKDAAREEYLRRMREDGAVNLAALAEDVGVNYDTVRRWKSKEKWTSWKCRPKRNVADSLGTRTQRETPAAVPRPEIRTPRNTAAMQRCSSIS